MDRSRGFTLFETVIVMFVLALVAGAALTPLRTQIEVRDRRATARLLDAAIEALYGYAATHGRLPCPDDPASSDGREDRFGARACVTREGGLPYVDLAVAGRDAWGRPLRYRVTAAISNVMPRANFAAADDGECAANDADLDLCERGDLVVRIRGDNPASAAQEAKFDRVLANAVPAVIVSHGANGHGAISARGLLPTPQRNSDERANADDDDVFYARDYAAAQTACADDEQETLPLCEFDDLLRWISPTILNHRLISAGRLP